MVSHLFRVFVCAAAISIVLAACVGGVTAPVAPATGDTQPSAQVVEVDFWMFPEMTTDTTGELVREIIAEFEADNPGIKVNLIGKSGGDIVSGLLVGATSQVLPGAVTGQLSNAYPNVLSGAIMDVAPYWHAIPEEWKSQFNPAIVNLLSKDEHIYGIPFTGFATVLFRNRTVLRNAGIDPDAGIEDWADWLEQMKQVKEAGYIALPRSIHNWWLTFHYYAGTGGTNDLTPDGKATTIDPKKLAQTYAFLKEAEQYGTDVSTFDQIATDLFLTDQMAFINQGPWFFVQMEEAKKQNVDLDYDYVLMPGQTAELKGGIMGGEFIAIMPGLTADAAWKWAAYLTDSPQMARLAAVLGRFVGNDVALQDPEVQKNDMVLLTAQATAHAVIELPLFVSLPENFLNPVSDYGLLVAQDRLTPEEAAHQAIEAINLSLQEAQ